METDLVFDVGAHNGNDTAYYLSRGFRVVAVEAHPQYCAALYRRFPEAIAAGELHILNFAVADKAGLCTLFESQAESQWNTTVREAAAGKVGEFREIIVPALTFDHVFARFDTPYYLKVDIEGSELNVFKHLIDKPQYVSFEVNKDLPAILELLDDLGYSQYKLVNQRLVHMEMVAWSGPFGEDIKGEWINRKMLEEQLTAAQDPAIRHPQDWFDVHAAAPPHSSIGKPAFENKRRSQSHASAPIKIERCDPSFTIEAKAFNVQPDGSAALAVAGSIPGGAVVLWNNQPLASSNGVSQAWIGAWVPADLYAHAGTATIEVLSRDGTTRSNALEFNIYPQIGPPPAIADLYPVSAVAGKGFNAQPDGSSAIAVNGDGFLPGARLFFDGKEMRTVFTRSTYISAAIPNALANRAGDLEVWVVNPDGKTSNRVLFKVAYE